jgi:hypothetical protein
VFNDDTDDPYKLKLFGLASRQMCDEFKLLVELVCGCAWLLLMFRYDDMDEHINGSWGFDDENGFDDLSLPPRMGRQGVQGCRAVRMQNVVAIMVAKLTTAREKRTKHFFFVGNSEKNNSHFKKDYKKNLNKNQQFLTICQSNMDLDEFENLKKKN